MPKVIKVALILSIAQIKTSSLLTNFLIVFIMTLTFINLLFGRGILTGLPEGASRGYKESYTGDVLITNLDNKNYIENSNKIYNLLDNSSMVKDYTVRYTAAMFVSEDLSTDPNDRTRIFAEVAMIDLNKENIFFDYENFIIDGEYLLEDTIVGSSLLSKYTATEGLGDTAINNVGVKDKILITHNGNAEELSVSGVIKAKVRQVERRVYVSKKDYVSLYGPNYKDSVKEIIVILNDGVNPDVFKKLLIDKEISNYANIKTFVEAQPQFVNDIKLTFSILGNIIGGVGLIISCITVFIIIYINAVSKRRSIGILKGIGISSVAIELSFVFQAIIYAFIGATLGTLFILKIAIPYFDANPLDFPFADGYLLAPKDEIIVRYIVLLLASAFSGYFPAYLITKQKTINAILGR